MTDDTSLKEDLIDNLVTAATEKLPTSSLGRIGRTGFAFLRSAKMIALDRRKTPTDAPEIDIRTITKVINSLAQLKGIAMKLGQIMSYIDMAMPEELQQALSVLQTHAQPMPFEKVKAVIADELEESGELLVSQMDPRPVSSASIGQVHRSVLPDGTKVAVKVQYPEIAQAIRADFGPAAVGTKMASLFYPHARLDDFIAEARDRFLEECDYLHEAHCQNRFSGIYRAHPSLIIPAVHQAYCSQKVLTTDFIDGLSFDAYLAGDPPAEERDHIGEALFEFYLGTLFRHQLYNCDPHPGNYLFLPDGKVAMLDHGCTRQFETPFVAKLANLTRAVHSDREEVLHRALLGLKIVRDDKPYDYDTIRGFLRAFFGPMLIDEVRGVDLGQAFELREMMQKKMQMMRFSLPGEFLFLFRIRFGLMSVLARLNARANWYRLEKTYVDEFAAAHPLLSPSTV